MQKIRTGISLEEAFAFAESFVREEDLDVSVVKQDAWWHSRPATEGQKKYLKGLLKTIGVSQHIEPGITKREASDLITFYKEELLIQQEESYNG